MRRFGLFIVAILAFGMGGAARCSANNLVVNGSFESPSLSAGSWTTVSNGTPGFGWTTTDGAGLMEVDTPGAIGGSSAYEGKQSLEVNADNPEDVYQTITGLSVGKAYVLSWAYGDRPGSGDEELQVYFTPTTDLTDATAVATDYDNRNGSNPTLLWFPNTVIVTATSTTEVLSFNGVYDFGVADNGGISYGNEIDAVSLVAAPEPSSLLFFVSGLGLLSLAWLQQRPLPVFGRH